MWHDDVCSDEYIHISFSFLGNDQNTTLSCTGSGTRTICSSTRWNGIVEATHCAVRSSNERGWNLWVSCEIFLSFGNFVAGVKLLRRFLWPSIRRTEVLWRMRCSDVNTISQVTIITPGGQCVDGSGDYKSNNLSSSESMRFNYKPFLLPFYYSMHRKNQPVRDSISK